MKLNMQSHVILVVLVTLSGCAKCVGSGASGSAENVLEECRVANDGDALLVPISIDGKEYRFLLDTGSDVTVCDIRLRDNLEKRGKLTNVELMLRRHSLQKIAVMQTIDLERFRQVSGHEIMGILGMDALHRSVLQVDAAAGNVRFLRCASSECGQSLNLVNEGHQAPCVVATIPGIGRCHWILVWYDCGSELST